MRSLLSVILSTNRGVELEQVLDGLYESIRGAIPCNRMGLALTDIEHKMIISRWAKSDRPMLLADGYQAPLAGSSLQAVFDTGKVRVINDLQAYAQAHPESQATQIIVQEGMRSSLTCPLIARDRPMGFLFFTSVTPNAYNDADERLYQQIASQVALVIEKARLYSDLTSYAQTIQRQNQAVRRDMELARQLQRTFIPQQAPKVDGLDIALLYEPLAEVGGDLVDFVPLPDGKLLVFVADAMGHGVSAALAMAVVKATFQGLAGRTPCDPAALLQALNQALPPILINHFAAALAMVIDPRQGRITSARAALPAPVIIDGTTGTLRTIEEGGLPLSIDNAELYVATEALFEPGDTLIITTDGVTEATNADGEEFGMQRLTAAATRRRATNVHDCLQSLKSDLITFRGERLPSDDMSVVLVRRT